MFELLLQADRSLSEGQLDQAERTYWQLIELDPTNAIAVAGLARIALRRGDERSAKTFAERALGIDPASTAARRVIDDIEKGPSDTAAPSSTDLALKGAEQLEALSRRRATTHDADGWTEGSSQARPPAPPVPPTRPRGGATPDALTPMPAEPLRERRRAGRLAAAAAAAAAAAREPRTRHEPHHAMPSGRRMFEPALLKAPPPDPFSEAEMAAAVAAVDALELAPAARAASLPAAAPEPVVEAASTASEPDLEHVMEAVGATEELDSVAMRLAFLGGPEMSSEPEAETEPEPEAELPTAPLAEESVAPPAEEPAVAWWTGAAETTRRHVSGTEEPSRTEETEVATTPDAQADDATRTPLEATEPATPARTEPYKGDPAEEEAELQAYREAMANVRASQEREDAVQPAGPVAWAPEDSAIEQAQAPGPAQAPTTPEPEAPPRKKGLFRRFRGS